MTSRGTSCYRVGDLSVDPGLRQVRRGDIELPVPGLSFDLLLALIDAAPNLLSLDELMRRVWPGLIVSPETVSQRIKLLRQALGDDPRNPRYIVGVRGRGYRLAAPVEPVPSFRATPEAVNPESPVATTGPLAISVGPARTGSSVDIGGSVAGRRNVLIVIAALVAGVVIAIGFATLSNTAGDTSSERVHSTPGVVRPVVAVLAFADSGRSDTDVTIPAGFRADMIRELSLIGSIQVIADSSVRHFRNSSLRLREIGLRLGATHLLDGHVRQSGDRLRIQARLIDVSTERQVWADNYERRLTATELFGVQEQIALGVANALQVTLSDAQHSAAAQVPTHDIEAWMIEKTARAQLARRTAESLSEAERLFHEAIKIDPQYARAYSGLADAIWLKADYAGLPWLPAQAEAERLANVALRIDPDLPEALATLAKISQERFDYDTAEAVYQRVFKLNPSYAMAHMWYAQLMYQQGRELEVRDASRRAVALDPMSALLRVNMGLSIADPDDLAAAVAWIEKAREIDPDNPTGAAGMATCFAFAGRYDEALNWSLAALELDPHRAGSSFEAARMHLELDDLDGASTWFTHALEQGQRIPDTSSHAALLSLYIGAPSDAVQLARRAVSIERRDVTAFMVLNADAFRRGEPTAVVDAVQRSYPELFGPERIRVRRSSLLPATDLALALQRSGADTRRAHELLTAASTFLDVARRNGSREYAIDNVRVAAIRQQADSALDMLGDAVASGWRGPYWRFHRDHDPAFDALRADPRFKKAFALVEQEVRSQRLRAAELGALARMPADAASE